MFETPDPYTTCHLYLQAALLYSAYEPLEPSYAVPLDMRVVDTEAVPAVLDEARADRLAPIARLAQRRRRRAHRSSAEGLGEGGGHARLG